MTSRHYARHVTPVPERDTGMTAIYAIGCLAVVIVVVVGICFA